MGIVLQEIANLGDLLKVKPVYDSIETQALAQSFTDLNEYLSGKLHFRFKNLEIKTGDK